MTTKSGRLVGAIENMIGRLPAAQRAEVQAEADRHADLNVRYAVVRHEVQTRLEREKALALRLRARACGLRRITFHVPAAHVPAAKAAVRTWAAENRVPLTLSEVEKLNQPATRE